MGDSLDVTLCRDRVIQLDIIYLIGRKGCERSSTSVSRFLFHRINDKVPIRFPAHALGNETEARNIAMLHLSQ